MSIIKYDAPPTVSAFMQSTAFLRLIAGPVGGGKTTGVLFEMLRRSIQQERGTDGFRRTRWAIVRTTLSQLKMTILLDVLTWFRAFAIYKVSDSLITIAFNDVISEWYLIPLEDPEDQRRLLSMNLTGVFISEAIELDADLVAPIAGRCGRFPRATGKPTWSGIIADTNMPVEGSTWHKLMELDKPIDWEIFIQPGGLEPDAENIVNLPEGRVYYERLARNPNPHWVTRYVHAQYGEDPSGTAVYRESFKRSFHVSKTPLEPVKGMIILIGQDFGRNPCSLMCQPDHKGRLIVLEEILAEDIGLETHIAKGLKPKLFTDRFGGMSFAAVGDPSGRAKGNFLEETSFDVMMRLGIPAFPATTNDVDARNRAVEQLLMSQRDGGAAIIIDGTRCPNLVRAMGGAYRYEKNKQGQTKPLPEKKHPWSDLADCLQYVCLTYNAGLTNYITRKIRPKKKRTEEVRTSAGWT